jgi:hypothetical protein
LREPPHEPKYTTPNITPSLHAEPHALKCKPDAPATHMPALLLASKAWHKVEAECKHFLFVASANNRASFFLIRIFFIQMKKSCHACCARTFTDELFFSGVNSHKQKVHARHWAGRIYFAGGNRWPAHAHCSCAPCPRRLPPQPPYACSGARSTHRDQRCREVHQLST